MQGAFPTSYLIGDGTGKGVQNSKYFVFEACEYRRHFLSYHPDYAIMTNIDFDHPDYYRDLDDVFSAFQQMALQVKKELSLAEMMSVYRKYKRKFRYYITVFMRKTIFKREMW